MKRIIPRVSLLLVMMTAVITAGAQSSLAEDQNPNYEVSRDKYMKIADSLTSFQSTTVHNTYKAIDYMEDRRIAREERLQFRRQLRLERARRNFYVAPVNRRWHNNWGFYDPYMHNRFYRNQFRQNLLWNTVPLALTWGMFCR